MFNMQNKLKTLQRNEDGTLNLEATKSYQSIHLNEEDNFLNSGFKVLRMVKSGADLSDIIDKNYKGNTKTQNAILKQVSFPELYHFIVEKDDFIMRTAKTLSYLSLMFARGLGYATDLLGTKLVRGSPVLGLCLKSLKQNDVDDDKKIKFLSEMLYWNKDEIRQE